MMRLTTTMTFRFLVLSLCVLSLTYGLQSQRKPKPRLQKEQASPKGLSMAYVMADGAEDVLGSFQESFTCTGRDYGYYADLANNCQIYHVCVPPNQQFTFFCNNGTVFDQKIMTCVRDDDATPCGSSEKFYALNQNFGEVDNNKLLSWESL